LPGSHAGDFRTFCQRNPAPCPLIEATEPGVFEPQCAPGADLRTDLPRYRCYRRGELTDQPTDITNWWTTGRHADNDAPECAVCFLLGCSFTFEAALLRAGIPVRHIEQGCNVPMYRTNIACKPAGAFSGPMVVSMRPMTSDQARRAEAITKTMPGSHGAPVHIGEPRRIGITDLDRPDYGDRIENRSQEIPVFWACGVTPLEAIMRAKPPWAIVHEPGHMFVTDLTI